MHESRGTKFRASVAHHNTSAENGTETWETKMVIDKKKKTKANHVLILGQIVAYVVSHSLKHHTSKVRKNY